MNDGGIPRQGPDLLVIHVQETEGLWEVRVFHLGRGTIQWAPENAHRGVERIESQLRELPAIV